VQCVCKFCLTESFSFPARLPAVLYVVVNASISVRLWQIKYDDDQGLSTFLVFICVYISDNSRSHVNFICSIPLKLFNM